MTSNPLQLHIYGVEENQKIVFYLSEKIGVR